MKRNSFLKNLIAAVLVAALTTMLYLTPSGTIIFGLLSDKINKTSFSKFASLEAIIDEYYIDNHNPHKLLDRAAHAYVDALGDRYGAYLNKTEFLNLQSDLGGEYRGIGITANVKNNKIHIEKIKENSPAQKSGLRTGDYIVAIDGKSYSGSTFSEAIAAIKNVNEKEDVVISVERDGVVTDITVRIEKIETSYVSGKMLEKGVGYIRIDSFGNKVKEDFENELQSLSSDGMSGLILDLRANPGGTLTAAVGVSDALLPAADIVSIRDKNGKEDVYKSDELCMDVPVCVLVDGESASASEVVAAALKDNGKATLVGQKTFGKGVVQSIFGFKDGTGLRITTAKYYTPSGVCIDGEGIKPDIEVANPYSFLSAPDGAPDHQLMAAISAVKNEMNK